MTRNISAAAMAVALLAMTTPAVAQVRIRHDGGQPSHGAARMRVPPPTQSAPTRTDQAHPTTPPAAATFKFDPHRHDQRRMRAPLGLGWGSFGAAPFWLWTEGIAPQTMAPSVVWLPPLAEAPNGDVQLDVEPRRAQVYVDGVFVGLVSDFSGYYQHLELVAGPHLITIIAPNYEPLIIEAMVPPGRTITHRGTLTRAYGR